MERNAYLNKCISKLLQTKTDPQPFSVFREIELFCRVSFNLGLFYASSWDLGFVFLTEIPQMLCPSQCLLGGDMIPTWPITGDVDSYHVDSLAFGGYTSAKLPFSPLQSMSNL